jgi:anti-sigma28 factor (negative regulator of flagellin synthesis)
MLNTVQESARLAREMDGVRQKKVKKYRSQLNSGRYQVRNKRVAKALWVLVSN